ncbi:putative amino acid-binding protein [Shewanella sediminis HAW-EB3]|uniref:Putative amino acid-binding protein n=1 Tax=Shewanella sediminis (strain HAW-EB3) TaxID=425104 RepID=A8G0A1_SHESH|nr:ABC transporter substrate-binding protein [Shewanella sediminis]ABV38524.1 putative amino acid-binding protein [Shewanella sediminis HAW-EB3]
MNIGKILTAVLLWVSTFPLFAAEVTMAFGEKIPPFCFPATDSGIEVEVIGEALAYRGHILKPEYYPFARIPVTFLAHNVDAAMTDLGRDMEPEGALYGDPAVFYDNVFITLKERNIIIEKPEDLQGLSVIAFYGAAKRYPKWLKNVQESNLYHEQNNQSLQALTLNRQHYDVVLSDRNIFNYFTLHLQREKGFKPKPVEEHHFVELNPMDYRPVFWDEHIRDDFNAGLKHLKETGRYQAIYDKYLK